MSITPFQIVNPDGSTNQEEYNRCMEFLQSYIAGTVQVYPELVWENPYEINEDSVRSSLEILLDEIYGGHDGTQEEVTNRLLTVNAFDQFRRFFRGFVKGISRTVIPDPRWLANQPNWHDNTSTYQYYDPFDFEEPEVIWEYNHLPYVNDRFRTLMGLTCLYNYRATETNNILTNISVDEEDYSGLYWNIPGYSNIENDLNYFNNSIPKKVYSGHLTYLFYRVHNAYCQSSAYYYFSQCNDELFTSGYLNYYDSRLGRNMYFTINQTQEFEGGKILSGCPLSQVATARSNVILNNSSLDITKYKASTAPCITPLYFDKYKNPYGAGVGNYRDNYALYLSNYDNEYIPYYRVTSEGQEGIVFSGQIAVVQRTSPFVDTQKILLDSINEGEYIEHTVSPIWDRPHEARGRHYTLTLRLYKQKLIDGPKIGVIDPGDNNTEHIINGSGSYTATNVHGFSGNDRIVKVSLNASNNFLVSTDDIT